MVVQLSFPSSNLCLLHMSLTGSLEKPQIEKAGQFTFPCCKKIFRLKAKFDPNFYISKSSQKQNRHLSHNLDIIHHEISITRN